MKYYYFEPEFWEEASLLQYLLFGILLAVFFTVMTTYLLLIILSEEKLRLSDLVILPSFYFCVRIADAMIKGYTSRD